LFQFVSVARGEAAGRHRGYNPINAYAGSIMPTNGCVLVVDDDPQVRDMLCEYLATHGYEVLQADGGAAMREEIERTLPDVVLMDVRLPGEDGLTLARYLRERYDVGIIMVTAAGAVVDRVVGLEIGADDYITKPFDPRELLARLKSVMRRLQAPVLAAGGGAAQRVVVGRCRLDLASHQLFDAGGSEVPITSMEYDLLRVFVEHPNKALSRDQILTLTKNREWDPFDRSIDIRIARLRRKIEFDPDRPQAIRTVRGTGYMFVPGRDSG
jgi:two-component system phosphate regulon response regulator OmpR